MAPIVLSSGFDLQSFVPPEYQRFYPLVMIGTGLLFEWLRRVTGEPLSKKARRNDAMWSLLAKVGLGLLNFANGSSFKSLAEAWAANLTQNIADHVLQAFRLGA